MRMKFMDLVEVAEDDVRRWFEHCETERECDDFARVMMESVKAESKERSRMLAVRKSSDTSREGD